jgi:hypothetical protein
LHIQTKLQLPQNFQTIANALVFSILAPNVQNNPTFVEIIAYPTKLQLPQNFQKISNALVFSIFAPNV